MSLAEFSDELMNVQNTYLEAVDNLDEDNPADRPEIHKHVGAALTDARDVKRRAAAYKAEVMADFQQKTANVRQSSSARSAVLGNKRKGFRGLMNQVGRASQSNSRAKIQKEKADFQSNYVRFNSLCDQTIAAFQKIKTETPKK